MKKLVILPEYQAILTPMSVEEYEGLKISVKERGQLLPIVVNQDHVILDGHNRYRVCQELNIEPITETLRLSKREEIRYVFTVNANRRHLNPIAMVILACKEHDSDWKIGDKVVFERNETETAMRFGCSKGMFHRAWQIVQKRPKYIEKILSGDMSYGEVYTEIIRDQRNESRTEALALAPPADAKLYLADFREVDIKKESIDAMIVDPPYGNKYLHLYDALRDKAVEWLRPEGSLMVMIGQYFLPDVLNRLLSGDLKYYWTIAYRMPGGTAFERTKPLQNAWKPIIWLTKGVVNFTVEETRTGTPWFPMGSDLVDSLKAEKSGSQGRDSKQSSFNSKWQQSVSGFQRLIQKCTKPSDTVLDPMMGLGTTGVAALKLKRKFIGIEIDPIPFKEANGRIVEEEKSAK